MKLKEACGILARCRGQGECEKCILNDKAFHGDTSICSLLGRADERLARLPEEKLKAMKEARLCIGWTTKESD